MSAKQAKLKIVKKKSSLLIPSNKITPCETNEKTVEISNYKQNSDKIVPGNADNASKSNSLISKDKTRIC